MKTQPVRRSGKRDEPGNVLSTLVNALGRDLRDAKEYAACRTFLRAAIDRYPHDLWLRSDMLATCLRLQPPAWLERHACPGTTLAPDSGYYHVMLAECYGALEAYDLAIEAHRKAISTYAEPDYAYYSLSRTLQRKGDLDGAIIAAKECLRVDPKSTQCQFQLGYLLLGKNELDGAIAAYRAASELAPNDAIARYNLGVAYYRKSDWEAASAAFCDAIRVDPSYRQAYSLLNACLAQSGKFAEARQNIRDALLKNPGWADDPRNLLRYNLACFAMKCADGMEKGKGDPQSYRHEAFDALTADLGALRKAADTDRPFVHGRLAAR